MVVLWCYMRLCGNTFPCEDNKVSIYLLGSGSHSAAHGNGREGPRPD